MASMTVSLPLWLRVLHAVIIVHFVLEIFYGGYMVMVQVRPEGVAGPLFGAAAEISHEMMVTRRLYASETWIATVGLALYLAITEILPRQLRVLLARKD